MQSFRADALEVRVFPNRAALGAAAAEEVAAALRSSPGPTLFASAPSQTETLSALATAPGIDWKSITAFHLDEYVGATAESAHSFRRFLVDHLLSKVSVGRFEGLRGEADDLHAECARYGALLDSARPSTGLIGIGENGHIAFNDPPDSRFDDPANVRVVQLTEACRQQQVHDATFPSLEQVPTQALSVTIPAIHRVPKLFVMVPGILKAAAVRDTVEGPVSETCPASILRTHPNAILFLDEDSASLLARRS